jgi:hypothetical protein
MTSDKRLTLVRGNRDDDLEPVAVGVDIRGDIREFAARLSSRLPAPGRVTNVNIYCSRDTPGRALCLVDVSGIAASEAAQALDGVPFAFSAVVLDAPIAADFSCPAKRPGRPMTANCNCSSGTCTSLVPGDS